MMTPPKRFHSIVEYREWRGGLSGTVGFVPTMGALHSGHARLMEIARRECDHVVLSIFVNPTQFGPGEDFDKYPRTLEKDLRLAAEMGVDAVFAPPPSEMYPPGFSTYVEEMALSLPLCGATRPGHFRGVTTVVLKLLNIVGPHRAFFGLKDAQQFFVIHRMARDLNLTVSIEGVPTVREESGLALSSRNQYLSPEERELAPMLYRVLSECASEVEASRSLLAAKSPGLLSAARTRLDQAGFRTQSLELLELPNLAPLRADTAVSAPLLLATASYLCSTRLIDNQILGEERLREMGVVIHDSTALGWPNR